MLENAEALRASEPSIALAAWQPPIDSKLSCEPRQRRLLIVGAGAENMDTVEVLLRHMNRFEPHITTAGTLAAGRWAMAIDDFDLVIFIVDSERDMAALEISGGPCVVVASAAPSRAAKQRASRKGITCIALADASPALFQDLLAQD